MKFDDFLHTVNDFGRYQKLRYFCICLTYMLPPVMVYTWSFAAATPLFRCKLYENDTVYDNHVPLFYNRSQPDESYCKVNMKISIKECHRCYMKTISTNVYTISRFILACSTRGIGVTGFVLATELVGPKSKFLTAIIVQYFFAFGQLFLNTTDKPLEVGVLALFQSKIMCIISINLFFQWFVQNLVFYGISQISFTISACVEILSYIVLHLLLNRIGRKRPYFIAVFCFAIIALLTISA
ncbi:unnamed protein product [Rotaria sp. Silwood1]|nr:unnamed protein product [Rotaria sp. Silwood1]CAF1182790.1 unnamed protein product [Rotaria sp. Silwood1]